LSMCKAYSFVDPKYSMFNPDNWTQEMRDDYEASQDVIWDMICEAMDWAQVNGVVSKPDELLGYPIEEDGMNIQEALKTIAGGAIRLVNHGTDDYARWLIWNEITSEYIVFASKEEHEIGTRIYHGDSEEDAVKALIDGTKDSFLNANRINK